MAKSYGTEAIDFAREQDAFIEHPVRCNRPSRNLWGAMIFVTVVGLAGFTYVGWTMHNSLVTQQVAIATMQQQLDAMYSAILVDKETTWNSKTFKEFPTKFVVDYVTPLKTQDERGTCWDFATVAVLENTYRQQGIAQGWMQEDEYMAISEQAYGAEVLRLCAGPPDSPQQVACLIPGNGVWKNTTEGGDASLLMYLINGLADNIYPHSTCPYYPDDGNDTVCPALTREKRKVNPLSLKLKKMETLMDEVSIKRAMVKDRRAMTLTTATPYTTHYYPCIGDFANEDRCKPASISCTLCPPKLSMTTCCVPIEKGESYNMNGEFITSHVMNIEGGHVMTLVGYNDLYRTKQGYTGGYILKNSWFDGIHPALGPRHARGSHSLKYWLQEITEWEEASMCPNSYNPENWYQCGNTAEVIDSKYDGGGGDAGLNIPLPMKRSSTVRGGIESCLSKETELYAKVNLQPLHLHCTDSSLCVVSNEYTYFVRNTTQWGDHMLRMCLFEYNTMTSTSSEVCFPPLLAQKIAYVLSPVQEEVHENDPDVCGFYFYPYQVQEHYKTQFGNFYVNNFDIEWQAQSYVANKVLYPDLDYHDVIESTYQQRQYEFIGPLPFAHVIAKKDLPSEAFLSVAEQHQMLASLVFYASTNQHEKQFVNDTIQGPPRLAFCCSADLDVSVSAIELMQRIEKAIKEEEDQDDDVIRTTTTKRDMKDDSVIQRHHEQIDSFQALQESFVYYFSSGAAAEQSMVSSMKFQELVQLATELSIVEKKLGGNAAIMAKRASAEGCRVLLGAAIGKGMQVYLQETQRIQVVGTLDATQEEDVHLVLEYARGEEFQGYVAPRANRYYLNHDVHNARLSVLEEFAHALDAFKPDLVIFGGLQLMEVEVNTQARLVRLKALSEVLQNLFRAQTPTHYEFAAVSDFSLFDDTVRLVLPWVESIGLNEQELFILHHYLLTGEEGTATTSRPSVADISAQLHDIIQFASKAKHDFQSGSQDKNKNGDKTLALAQLSRIHFHTLQFHIVCQKDGSIWEDPTTALVQSALMSSKVACGKPAPASATSDDDKPQPMRTSAEMEVDPERIEILLARQQLLSKRQGLTVDLDPFSPVVTWQEADFQCHLVPMLACKKPDHTAGLGDNISGTGVSYHRLQKKSKTANKA